MKRVFITLLINLFMSANAYAVYTFQSDCYGDIRKYCQGNEDLFNCLINAEGPLSLNCQNGLKNYDRAQWSWNTYLYDNWENYTDEQKAHFREEFKAQLYEHNGGPIDYTRPPSYEYRL